MLAALGDYGDAAGPDLLTARTFDAHPTSTASDAAAGSGTLSLSLAIHRPSRSAACHACQCRTQQYSLAVLPEFSSSAASGAGGEAGSGAADTIRENLIMAVKPELTASNDCAGNVVLQEIEERGSARLWRGVVLTSVRVRGSPRRRWALGLSRSRSALQGGGHRAGAALVMCGRSVECAGYAAGQRGWHRRGRPLPGDRRCWGGKECTRHCPSCEHGPSAAPMIRGGGK